MIQKNVFTFERLECKNASNGIVNIVKCVGKSISRTRVRGDVLLTLNRTIYSVFAHFVAYYQFSSNEYRPYLFNLWEDVCATLGGDNGNIISNILFEKARNYTNFNHPCPYMPGQYFAKVDNISVNILNFGQLLPAGRYRVELNVTEGYKGLLLGMSKLYFSISDRRVTQF